MNAPKRPFKFSDWIAAGQFLDEHDAACGMGAFIDREPWTGDIVTYPNGRNQWRITFVDADTVKMIGL